jgi:hypothetical protein
MKKIKLSGFVCTHNVKYYPLKILYTLHITVEVQHLKIMMKTLLILGTSTNPSPSDAECQFWITEE